MSFQGTALSFTSLFGEGMKPVDQQNHIFPESELVTCSIIESSRGSLICVPITDGVSSDCSSYLNITGFGETKDKCSQPAAENGDICGEPSAVECEPMQDDEETSCRLFVETQVDTEEDTSQLIMLHNEVDTVPDPQPINDNQDLSKNVSENQDTETATTEPAKKVVNRGGWPKGKKRKKKSINIDPPKAPATGYTLFLNKRRGELHKSNPEIPFLEVTKQIGNEWTNLPKEEKLVFLKKAEDEKKRYREELKAYQQSEAFLASKTKPKTVEVEVNQSSKEDSKTISVPIHDIEDEDYQQLYCSLCDILFSSVHNKKEHLYGKLHLAKITGNIRELTSQNGSCVNGRSQDSREESLENNSSPGTSGLKDKPISVAETLLQLVSYSRDQLNEIEFLKRCNGNLRQHKNALNKDLQLLEELRKTREDELATISVEGKTLSSQLVELRMVPHLFGIINF